MSYNWTCPHCSRIQTIVPARMHQIEQPINVGPIHEGQISVCTSAVGCANPECNRLTISFSVRSHMGYRQNSTYKVDYNSPALFEKRAIPNSYAKPQPDCIPKPLVEDYVEACLISEDSPKASATLSRRCMQGMIRDFCGIQDRTLAKEIDALRRAVEEGRAPAGVTSETVDAIDHVRTVGNIGAHMEKEIDLIVPVDPQEAHALIELIEMLFEEWYVARDSRQKKLATISKIGEAKNQLIAEGRAALKALPGPDSEPISSK